ncbi:MAG TPA: 2-dehydropantoate 2-reductase N-terminal domain-containing protein [Puia sp.]|nr:2-dehydropantoate 2-reductase N-terminal domain-containing protein [Puia sp.]
MKICIYGAGVIGCIYAARLHEAGCKVTLLARNERYATLNQNGIVIKNVLNGKQTTTRVPLTRHLETNDRYDLILVTVRLDQLEAVIPDLNGNNASTLIMFMLNNPDIMETLTNELKQKHIVLGFPGIGGSLENNIIDYIQIKQQHTTIGEINGENSVCISQIKMLFERAGFKVSVSGKINAWLKIHAVFVACIAASIINENGDSAQLGKKRSSIRTMVQSISEGFIACKSLGIPIVPANLKIIFLIMPQWFTIWYWQKAMQGNIGIFAIAPHANKAKNEMQLLAKKVLTMVHSSSFPAPTLDRLLSSFVNAH